MSNDLDYFMKPIVLVTGFGPFLNHPVNASWEAVKLMNKQEIEKKHNVEFVPIEIPVTYHNVDEFVPALWETHEPKLMIHVGVSNLAENLTLETQAHRKGYKRTDYYDRFPVDQTCPVEGGIRLHTKLNVDRLCKEFNEECPLETSAVSSYDAGRYLCEYIYYTSLSIDNTRTLFVHVPDVQVYPSERTARSLERLLDLCLQQLAEEENKAVVDKMASTTLEDEDNDDYENAL